MPDSSQKVFGAGSSRPEEEGLDGEGGLAAGGQLLVPWACTLQGRAWRPGPLGRALRVAPTTFSAGGEPVTNRHCHETWMIR